MKKYNAPPLPFLGNKRNFIKQFNNVISEKFNDKTLFIDVFGGSGLLAHNIKQINPQAKVIFNDFDGYSERLNNIVKTNGVLEKIYTLLGAYSPDDKIKQIDKEAVCNYLEAIDGYLDIVTISSHLLFSGRYVKHVNNLRSKTLYKSRTKFTPVIADGYLEGVEIVKLDYLDLITQAKRRDAVFICDPPYLGTLQDQYTGKFGLAKTLSLITAVIDENHIFFTSENNEVEVLYQHIKKDLSYEKLIARLSMGQCRDVMIVNLNGTDNDVGTPSF